MSFLQKIEENVKLIFTWNPSDRLWQMPFFASLGVAIVLFVAAFFERPDLGLVAIIGTNIFLYVFISVFKTNIIAINSNN